MLALRTPSNTACNGHVLKLLKHSSHELLVAISHDQYCWEGVKGQRAASPGILPCQTRRYQHLLVFCLVQPLLLWNSTPVFKGSLHESQLYVWASSGSDKHILARHQVHGRTVVSTCPIRYITYNIIFLRHIALCIITAYE